MPKLWRRTPKHARLAAEVDVAFRSVKYPHRNLIALLQRGGVPVKPAHQIH